MMVAFERSLDGLHQAIHAVRAAAASNDLASTPTGSSVDPFIFQLAIFVLSIYAISSVIVVGALLAVGLALSGYATFFGFLGLIFASINIFGGFLVTQRMLAMYKKKER